MPEDLCKVLSEVVKGQHARLLRITTYRHSVHINFHQRELQCSKRSKSDTRDSVAEKTKVETVTNGKVWLRSH